VDKLNDNARDKMYFYTEDCIKFNEPGYKARYYMYYGINDVQGTCKDYLTGLLWVLGYYNGHSHKNWTWSFGHHAAPFASDLYDYLNKDMRTFQKHIAESDALLPSKEITPIQQLLMVLPRESLIPIVQEINPELANKLNRLFMTESTDLERHYPERISVDLVHKQYLWQSKVFFDQFSESFLNILF
jgi:5'-3' exonuclease